MLQEIKDAAKRVLHELTADQKAKWKMTAKELTLNN
jgi:hypothetical protein